jgi:ATP-dependent Clp protease ATP-binding subunit ClpA
VARVPEVRSFGKGMITPLYLRTWMMAKGAARRLGHPVVTSEHLFYACLRLHDQRHWTICRDLPVTAKAVWSHLRESSPPEASEDFAGVRIGISAKAALEQAESESCWGGHSITGTESLMRALLSEREGPVRSLLGNNALATTGPDDERPRI